MTISHSGNPPKNGSKLANRKLFNPPMDKNSYHILTTTVVLDFRVDSNVTTISVSGFFLVSVYGRSGQQTVSHDLITVITVQAITD